MAHQERAQLTDHHAKGRGSSEEGIGQLGLCDIRQYSVITAAKDQPEEPSQIDYSDQLTSDFRLQHQVPNAWHSFGQAMSLVVVIDVTQIKFWAQLTLIHFRRCSYHLD